MSNYCKRCGHNPCICLHKSGKKNLQQCNKSSCTHKGSSSRQKQSCGCQTCNPPKGSRSQGCGSCQSSCSPNCGCQDCRPPRGCCPPPKGYGPCCPPPRGCCPPRQNCQDAFKRLLLYYVYSDVECCMFPKTCCNWYKPYYGENNLFSIKYVINQMCR